MNEVGTDCVSRVFRYFLKIGEADSVCNYWNKNNEVLGKQ